MFNHSFKLTVNNKRRITKFINCKKYCFLFFHSSDLWKNFQTRFVERDILKNKKIKQEFNKKKKVLFNKKNFFSSKKNNIRKTYDKKKNDKI